MVPQTFQVKSFVYSFVFFTVDVSHKRDEAIAVLGFSSLLSLNTILATKIFAPSFFRIVSNRCRVQPRGTSVWRLFFVMLSGITSYCKSFVSLTRGQSPTAAASWWFDCQLCKTRLAARSGSVYSCFCDQKYEVFTAWGQNIPVSVLWMRMIQIILINNK